MKKAILFMYFFVFCNLSYANVYNHPDKFENILRQIPKAENIKCKFYQEKYLKNVQKPVISKGDFEFIENKGVYFYTHYPVEIKTDYTNKNYKQINEIISAINSKKYSKLEKEFDFYFEKNKNNWSLVMKPKKNSKSYGYISSITIDGNKNIDKISILQTNGNKTLIWFKK